ncbi:MAG TPA: CopG family transcriptional regulator [Gemmatimonadaceae bacterium]|nr:CopG family transcriptional regulator [Gemmatimonadaceae bacterium]
MKRTSLFIDDQLIKRLQKLARTRGVSFATVVREALAQYLTAPGANTGVPSIAGRFRSGHADTSERVDELLWTDPHA